MEYIDFLESRKQRGSDSGFEPLWIPDFLFDFQKALVEWAIRKGRCALFEDCGLGKTPQQLVWAENVARKTDRPVLILAPLAVSAQTKRESEKFGIECHRSMDGTIKGRVNITNYEKLSYFKPDDFSGVVCDESSILKSFDGARKSEITEFMKRIPYRLLATATAAPNDYIELGTSSEAIGYLGFMDMLNRFFKNDNNNSGTKRMFGEAPKWRFKGHAELPFWRWVTSWARACRKPSDLGFDNTKFNLPGLIENEHLVEAETLPDGYFLPIHASNLPEQREEKRRTIKERCEQVLELITDNETHSLVWCQLNDEGDYLEKIIPNSIQVSGSTSDEKREEIVDWFLETEKSCKLSTNNIIFKICKNMPSIGSVITEKTEQGVLPNLLNINENTKNKEKNTIENIIYLIKSDGIKGLQSNGKELILLVEKDIELILNIAKDTLKNQSNGESKIQKKTLQEFYDNTTSQLTITEEFINCNAESAQSADYLIREILENTDYTLTTVIKQKKYAGCSAQIATSQLENLRTIQNYLKKQLNISKTTKPRVLISKPKIFGFGLNFQHCSHIVYFPSHSYEQYYQAVRRCWRFGQKNDVIVDIVLTEGERKIMRNLQRKNIAAAKMFDNLVTEMNNSIGIKQVNNFTKKEEIPSWL